MQIRLQGIAETTIEAASGGLNVGGSPATQPRGIERPQSAVRQDSVQLSARAASAGVLQPALYSTQNLYEVVRSAADGDNRAFARLSVA